MESMVIENSNGEIISSYKLVSNPIIFSSGSMIKPVPKQVIFNDPYTIVNWEDGTKTVVKCMPGDTFNKDIGFCVAVARKVFGGHNQYKKYVKNAHVQSNQAPA